MKEHGLKVFINFTITQINMDSIFNTIALASSLGAEAFLGIKAFVNTRGESDPNKLVLSYDKWRELLLQLTLYKKRRIPYYDRVCISVMCPWEFYLPLSGLALDENDLFSLWNYRSPLHNPNYRRTRNVGCTAGITNCGVQSDGTVFPCGIISARVPGLECGSLADQSFSEIWSTSPVLKQFRTLRLEDLDERCQSCTVSNICGGGCRSRAYILNNSILGPDSECPLMTEGGK
jgi:radical SAM protein with 4Fe4S-binding SPASM domain